MFGNEWTIVFVVEREIMLTKIKCFFGFHKWELHYLSNDFGYAHGHRCKHCGRWNKNAIKGEWRGDEI